MSLKNPVIPPGIDPGTFRLVAQCIIIIKNKLIYKTRTEKSTDAENELHVYEKCRARVWLEKCFQIGQT